MAQQSKARKSEWLNRVQSEQSFKHQYQGSNQHHSSKTPFRDEDQSKFFGRRNVISYTNLTSKERADKNSKEYKSGYLERTQYQNSDPNRMQLHGSSSWLKSRAKSHEKNIGLTYKVKNETDRLNSSISQSKKSFEPLNTKMLYYPKCREEEKTKWMSTLNFVGMSGPKDNPWSPTPIIEAQAPLEPFSQKFVSIEDFSRKRDTLREVGKNEWDACSHHDSVWSKRLQSSNSLRTYKSIQGYIQSIEGRIQCDSNINTARETISSLRSNRKMSSEKSLKYLSKVKVSESRQNDNISTNSQSLMTTPIPTKYQIQNGDVQKIQDLLQIKKEFPQQTALFFLPNQQLQSSQNQKFKVSGPITDQYLLDKIQNSRQKTYYKSAEQNLNKKSGFKNNSINFANNNNVTLNTTVDKSQVSQHQGFKIEKTLAVNEAINNIDLGKIILSDRSVSKDSSPLLSGQRQISVSNTDDQAYQQEAFNINFNPQNFSESSSLREAQQSPSQKIQVFNHHKTHSIQEESDETDEESSAQKIRGTFKSLANQNSAFRNINLNDQSPTTVLKNFQKVKKNQKNDLEFKSQDLQTMNPVIQKEARQTQLKGLMNEYFSVSEQIKQNKTESIQKSPSKKSSQKKL